VGKSTFIEALGLKLLESARKVAVLTVDPSSPITGGSILGDKTRMDSLARDPRAYIRPSPSSGNLGGVTRHTREVIITCEAAGFDTVIVETVGVGQSEVVVASMVDIFVALQLPNSGDELQGIKKGILELADLVVVNKADGGLLQAARQAKADLERAVALVRQGDEPLPKVLLTSSTAGSGISEVAAAIFDFVTSQRSGSKFERRRSAQAISWFRAELGEQLRERLEREPKYLSLVGAAETSVASGRTPGSIAARKLIDEVFAKR
jgi:LAO/AO transport system kinase